jgi:hypothetical protein
MFYSKKLKIKLLIVSVLVRLDFLKHTKNFPYFIFALTKVFYLQNINNYKRKHNFFFRVILPLSQSIKFNLAQFSLSLFSFMNMGVRFIV